MITPDQRRATARALVAAQPPEPDHESPRHDSAGMTGWLWRLCRAAAHTLPAAGAGISVMTPEGLRGVAAASDLVTEALERLQITLGEGPCIDSYSTRRPVLVPDLTTGAGGRWPGYRAAALQGGAAAVFAFPLQWGAARLGVLDVYQLSPGMMAADALAQALTFAEVTVETLLDGQENAQRNQTEPALDRTLDRALGSQYTVYQAQGMATIDLGVSLADAMARMQAHAYAHDRPVHDVARDIVAGLLRLEPDAP